MRMWWLYMCTYMYGHVLYVYVHVHCTYMYGRTTSAVRTFTHSPTADICERNMSGSVRVVDGIQQYKHCVGSEWVHYVHHMYLHVHVQEH